MYVFSEVTCWLANAALSDCLGKKLLFLSTHCYLSGFPPAAGESILGSPKELMFNLPPSIRPGGEVEAYVTTSLSADGVFWAQLLEGGWEYDALSERLQEVVAEMKGLYTPVFYSPGDICAAMFSGDQLWYRARVERVQGGKVSVIGGGGCRERHTFTHFHGVLTYGSVL